MLRNKSNENFEKYYLPKQYQPAQEWYKKTDSSKWIERHIPTLNELLEKNYRKVQKDVYCIHFNDVPVYVGEAIKASDRLLVHAHNLYREPLAYFGVTEEEINSGEIKIKVTILEENLSEDLRKANELSWIEKLKPLIQKNDGTDRCIPRRDRRKVIEKEILNKLTDTTKLNNGNE